MHATKKKQSTPHNLDYLDYSDYSGYSDYPNYSDYLDYSDYSDYMGFSGNIGFSDSPGTSGGLFRLPQPSMLPVGLIRPGSSLPSHSPDWLRPPLMPGRTWPRL